MITATIIGERELITKLRDSIPSKVRQELAREVESLAIKLTAKVKGDKLSGQVLNVRTGTLRRSINYKMSASAKAVTAVVGTNVEYARIHEFGGRTARGIVMPERSYLRSTLADMKKEITEKLGATVRKAVNLELRK